MVESGSTTEYTGNGHPFPNWLVYDSSLFEVKVNGEPAKFIAPSPQFNIRHSGYTRYNNLFVPQINNAIDISSGFNLFANISEDGQVPPPQYNPPNTYKLSDNGPMEMLSVEEEPSPTDNPFGIDLTKPIYLHNVDWGNMSGQPNIEYALYDYPHIHCDSLNLTLIYDADYGTWVTHHGNPVFSAVIEWRFKQLHDIRNSPVFLNTNDLNYNSTYIYTESMLNPLITMVPNVSDPTKVEVHARSLVKDVPYDRSMIYPYYKGVPLTAWPDVHNYLVDKFQLIADPTFAFFAIPTVSNDTLIARINNEPAWISLNTLPESYDPMDLGDSLGYYRYVDDMGEAPLEIDTDGVVELSSANATVRYIGRTGVWYVVNSNTEIVTVQLLHMQDQNGNRYNIPSSYKDDNTSVYWGDWEGSGMFYAFSGFTIANAQLSSKPIDAMVSTTDSYLTHERVTTRSSDVLIFPNFEEYAISDFSFYANGKLIEPTIKYGVNDEVTEVSYYIPDLDETINYNIAGMYISHTLDTSKYQGMTNPSEEQTYFLDGKRLDNLDINPSTGLFNRFIPLHLQWMYNSTIPLLETKPLFIYVDNGELTHVENFVGREEGVYLEYFYTEEGKTATVSYAPKLDESNPYTTSLAMIHERDIIRGWKKSGYKGPTTDIYDIYIRKDSIGYPIVLRNESEEPGESVNASPLPLTFSADSIGLVGNFDLLINGEVKAYEVNADNLPEIIDNRMSETLKYVVTEESIPFSVADPAMLKEMQLDGEFDIIIDGETVLTNVTADDIIELEDLDNLSVYPVEVNKEPAPEIVEAT